MVNKIEFYREVLEIEPNSKVFFPLARKLAEQGDAADAVAVLERGIAFHPDHLEAKFLLIELLTGLGRENEADKVFSDVGTMLSNYPSVWLLWSREAAHRSKDPSLAMLFLANYFQNKSLTWAEVMERGLESLRRAAAPVCDEKPEGAAASSAMPQPQPEPRPEEKPDASAPQLRGAREVMELAASLDAPEEAPSKAKSRGGKGQQGAGVRTKTMAALLAEQGDTAGALAIYDELHKSAPSAAEREDIAARMAALAPGDKAASPADDNAAPPAQGPDAPGKPKSAAKLVSFLEALAGRLDARAGG
jgi:tetratricopeptide (TPR) repeat protein